MATLGDRMKAHEAVYTHTRLPREQYVVARVDGRCFSTFTRAFDKPHDEHFAVAMQETAHDLMAQFHASLAYTFSDEITLVWTPKRAPKDTENEWQEHTFGGRVLKFATVLSGFASVAFYRHLSARTTFAGTPHFDARVFSVPTPAEVANAVLWRARDCWRNAVSGLARCHFSARQLHGKHSGALIEMLAEAGVDFHAKPGVFKWGMLYTRQAFVTEEGQQRSRVVGVTHDVQADPRFVEELPQLQVSPLADG